MVGTAPPSHDINKIIFTSLASNTKISTYLYILAKIYTNLHGQHDNAYYRPPEPTFRATRYSLCTHLPDC